MVEDFGVSEQNNATYVGLLASTFFFCQFATSVLWGAASDKYGRRPCLLWGVALNGVAMIQFGFASTYGQAVLGRALAGGLSGNVAISKSYLGEVTAGSRSAKGFGLLGFVWGIGSVTAPIAGGYLSNPTTRFPAVFAPESFPLLVQYPYLLPSVLSAIVALMALVVGVFCLPETPAFLARQRQLQASGAAPAPGPVRVLADNCSKLLQWATTPRIARSYQPVAIAPPRQVASAAPACGIELAAVHPLPTATGHQSEAPGPERHGNATFESASAPVLDQPEGGVAPILHAGGSGPPPRSRRCCSCTDWLLSRGVSDSTAMCIASYACVAMAQVLFDELMPIFAKTAGVKGGLSFDSGQVGLVLTIQGAALILYQPLFFPIIVQWVGAVRLFTFSAVVLVPVFLTFPALTLVYNCPVTLWSLLSVSIVAKACLLANMFTGILMLTTRSARGANLGKVNGLSQASSAAVRSVSPFVGGLLYSLAATVPGRLHAVIPYALPAVVLAACAWLSRRIPPSLNFEEEDEEPNTDNATACAGDENDSKVLLPMSKAELGYNTSNNHSDLPAPGEVVLPGCDPGVFDEAVAGEALPRQQI